MTELEGAETRLKAALSDLLLPIQAFRGFDPAAAKRVEAEITLIPRLLKGTDLLPRSLLNEMRTAARVLSNEAPHAEENRRQLIELSGNIEMAIDLIFLGESFEDRGGGLPRVV